MALSDIKGLGFIESIDMNSILSTTGQLFTGLLIFIIIALLVGVLLYLRSQGKLYSKNVHFFEEIKGELVPYEDYKCAELTIPNTNLRVFYIKSIDLYLPRATRQMNKDHYWYAVKKNREIINFGLKNINKEMKEADLDYDHTDMRYANEYLAELINRNFRSKSVKWWQEYKELISIVVIVFAFTFGAFFLLGKMADVTGAIGELVRQVSLISEQNRLLLEQYTQLKTGSGINLG